MTGREYYTILCYTVEGLLIGGHKIREASVELCAGRPGGSEVPRNPLTRWDVSSIPANGIFLTKKPKN